MAIEKKKICWVTPDAFLDTDLDYKLMSGILDEFDIYWIVLFKAKENRFKESDFEPLLRKNKNLKIKFLHAKSRMRNPLNLLHFNKIKTVIKEVNPDLIYFNVVPTSPYVLPLYFWLPKDKTIVTAHDGRVTASMSFAKFIRWGFKAAFRSVKHVNMFSNYQASFFNQNFPGKDITVIPLSLKDFGLTTCDKRSDVIGFVYFGAIHFEKNIELLIEAANQLYEEGIRGFKVCINGMWRIPGKPEDLIRHNDIFELNIQNVPNEAIPNIFAYNHYAVYPYKNMSQSGAIKCAYNYNTPVIVSDLPGFIDEMQEGVDGFSFKSENIEDLKRVMRECINRSNQDYFELCRKMKEHIDATYAKTQIVRKYVNMFNKVLLQCQTS